MVKSINEILKYLLGISKCTKLPGKNKKGKKKEKNPKQTQNKYICLHIRHIYILEIIMTTIYLKSFLFSEKVVYPTRFQITEFSNNDINKNKN